MGAKRKVDIKLYNKISKELKSPKDDKKVMEKYNLGQTAVRAIRNSSDYYDYVCRTSHGKMQKREITLNSPRRPATPAERAVIVATWLSAIAMVFAVYLILRWLFEIIFRR